ncbi:MAG TPA: hypothetical protein VGN88_03415, partial [Phycisphaerae bacterium]
MSPTSLALRSPSFLPTGITAILFENHYLWWLAAIVLGAALIFVARSRSDRRLLRAGQIILALTLLWLLSARLIDTPAERLYNAHVALADAAAKADVDRLLSYFEPHFSIDSIKIGSDTLPTAAREEIATALKQYGIKDSTYRAYAQELFTDRTAATRFTILTQSEMDPILSSWVVSWNDE